MIVFVCQATGWTWDYVEDHVTVPRFVALSRFWRQSPPPHAILKLIAQALGWKPIARDDAGDAWADLCSAGADPGSGIAIKGEPPFRS